MPKAYTSMNAYRVSENDMVVPTLNYEYWVVCRDRAITVISKHKKRDPALSSAFRAGKRSLKSGRIEIVAVVTVFTQRGKKKK